MAPGQQNFEVDRSSLPPILRRLPFDIHRYRLTFVLDTHDDCPGNFVGRIAAKVRGIWRGVNRFPRLYDSLTNAFDFKRLFPFDNVSELVPLGMHVQRQSESRLPLRRENDRFLTGQIL